jgi:hypothetical protein
MIVVRGGADKPVSSQKLADYFEKRSDLGLLIPWLPNNWYP